MKFKVVCVGMIRGLIRGNHVPIEEESNSGLYMHQLRFDVPQCQDRSYRYRDISYRYANQFDLL